MKKITDVIKKMNTTDKNLLVNMLGALLIKGAGLFLSLFTMPVYMSYFNDDVTLGLWFTILSVLHWVLYFDLGIGNGLRNCLTESLTLGDQKQAKTYISSAYVSIGAFCLISSLVFIAISFFINWNQVFNISDTTVSSSALQSTTCIVFIGILLQLFLKLITSVLYAIQKSAINNLLGLITSALQVIAIYLLPSYDNDSNIIMMAIVNTIATLLPLIFASLIIFCKKKYKDIKPSLAHFSKAHAKGVMSLGITFLIAQVCYMVIMNTNEYLITLFVGNEYVVEYQVYYKLFGLIGTLFTLLLTPLWSAITKALAEKKNSWIYSLYKKTLLIACLGILSGFALVLISQFIVDIWLSEQAITLNGLTCVLFAILSACMITNSVLSTFSNGIGDLSIQVITFSIGAVLKIPLAYIFVRVLNSWEGVILANIFTLCIYIFVQPFALRKYFKIDEVTICHSSQEKP